MPMHPCSRESRRTSGCSAWLVITGSIDGYAFSMIAPRLLLPILILLLAGCSTVAGTGRSQMRIISSQQEHELGEQAVQEASAEMTIIRNGR